MKIPLFFPVELNYSTQYDSPEDVFNALASKSIEDVILFFEACCYDETWTREVGGPYLKFIFEKLTKQYLLDRLNIDQAKRIASTVQQHYQEFKLLIVEDIKFQLEGKEVTGNSLMFGASSLFFDQLIRRERKSPILIKEYSLKTFEEIKEFIYSGTITDFWKENPADELSIIRVAAKLNMNPLEEYGSSIFKRYINDDNVIDILNRSSIEGLQTLKNMCCEYVNHQSYGIRLFSHEYGELRTELDIMREEGWDFLAHIVKLITHIESHKLTTEDPLFVQFLKTISKLVSLDLSHSSNVQPDLIHFVPSVSELNLSSCPWLDDDMMKVILSRIPNVIKLYLQEVAQLSYRTWGALSANTRLGVLDLTQCRSIGDDEFDLILTNCPGMIELSVSGCNNITSKHMGVIGKRCPEITSLNLSSCRMIADTGFAMLAANTPSLRSLDVSYCGGISDQVLDQMLPLLGQLRYLNILGCFVADSFVDRYKEERPSLKIEH
jgi:hypothetical protein